MENMSYRFQKAMAFVFRWEGGYVNDPADPGGETKYGISKRSHPEVDIASLTREDAKRIYRAKYWRDTGGALEDSRGMGAVAAVLFDFAVHSGVERSIVELQAAVGTTADGIIGPLTKAFIDRHALQLLARELIESRRRFLADLVERSPDLGKFAEGWNRRLVALGREIDRGAFS